MSFVDDLYGSAEVRGRFLGPAVVLEYHLLVILHALLRRAGVNTSPEFEDKAMRKLDFEKEALLCRYFADELGVQGPWVGELFDEVDELREIRNVMAHQLVMTVADGSVLYQDQDEAGDIEMATFEAAELAPARFIGLRQGLLRLGDAICEAVETSGYQVQLAGKAPHNYLNHLAGSLRQLESIGTRAIPSA